MSESFPGPRCRRGMSIAETIVVAVLMFMLFYYIYKLLEPGLRVWRQSEKRVSLQQSTLISMYRITGDLKESNKYSVTLRNYDLAVDGVGTVICFASARDQDGTMHTRQIHYGSGPVFDSGEPEWQKYVFYYLDNKRRIRRFETNSYTTYKETDGMHLKVEPLMVISPSNPLTNAVIARNIKTFQSVYSPDPLSDGASLKGLTITIGASYPDPDPRERFDTELETTVGVRYLEKE
jgi:hypothetical protein